MLSYDVLHRQIYVHIYEYLSSNATSESMRTRVSAQDAGSMST